MIKKLGIMGKLEFSCGVIGDRSGTVPISGVPRSDNWTNSRDSRVVAI